VRISYGSAILLRLFGGALDVDPTTVYLLTYHPGKCRANCAFCPQSRDSNAKADRLSRVIWPVFETKEVIGCLVKSSNTNPISRICVQSLNYENVFVDILGLVYGLRRELDIPISLSTKPLNVSELRELKKHGLDRVSIPLDCSTRELFERIKGSKVGAPYSWDTHLNGLKNALEVFGSGRVTTHVIVGLGETDRDLISLFQYLTDLGIFPGLFAFTPIKGTQMAEYNPPSISRYRKIQLLHFLITHRTIRFEDLVFSATGELIRLPRSKKTLRDSIRSGLPFLTSGCPGCNRPFYNERPGETPYNFPRPLKEQEIKDIEDLLLR